MALASFGKPRTSLSVVSASAAITLIVSPRSRIRTSAAPAVPRCSSRRRAASTDTWATRSASHASTPAKRVRETRNVTDCLNELHSAATTADFVVASGSLPLGVHDDYFQRVADVCRDRGAPLVLDTSGAALRHITSGVFMLKCGPAAEASGRFAHHQAPGRTSRPHCPSTPSRSLQVGAICGFALRRLRRGFPAGTNDSCSATNDSSPGDFGPYYPGGTGCRMETVRVRSRKVRINTVGESALGSQRSQGYARPVPRSLGR